MGCIVSCLQDCRKQKEQDQRPLERNASEKLKSGQDDIIPIAKPRLDNPKIFFFPNKKKITRKSLRFYAQLGSIEKIK